MQLSEPTIGNYNDFSQPVNPFQPAIDIMTDPHRFFPQSYGNPNFITDWLMMELNSINEHAVCSFVYRKTAGWNKIEDGISMSQFMKFIPLGEKAIRRNINSLIKDGWIKRRYNKRLDGGDSYPIYSMGDRFMVELMKLIHEQTEKAMLADHDLQEEIPEGTVQTYPQKKSPVPVAPVLTSSSSIQKNQPLESNRTQRPGGGGHGDQRGGGSWRPPQNSLNTKLTNTKEREKENLEKSAKAEKLSNNENNEPSAPSLSFDERFTNFLIAFWETYPKRKDGLHHQKKQAQRVLRKIDPEQWKTVIAAVKNYKIIARNEVRDGAIFYAVNWLKNWKDYIPKTTTAVKPEQQQQLRQQQQQSQEDKQEQAEQEEAKKWEVFYQSLPKTTQKQVREAALKQMFANEFMRDAYIRAEKLGEKPLERPAIRGVFREHQNQILKNILQNPIYKKGFNDAE